MSEHATTGDGVLTALHVARRMASSGRTLADLAAVMSHLPQVLVNVPDVDKARADTDPVLQGEVAIASARLGDSGRVLLRQSGTEPLVRVMVEAATAEQASEIADHLAERRAHHPRALTLHTGPCGTIRALGRDADFAQWYAVTPPRTRVPSTRRGCDREAGQPDR